MGETFYTHIFAAFLETGNKNVNFIVLHQIRKRRRQPTLTRWLKGWVSQTHQLKNNDNTILDVFFSIRGPNQTSQEELKSFKFAIVIITKLKALLIKSLTNLSISSRLPTL